MRQQYIAGFVQIAKVADRPQVRKAGDRRRSRARHSCSSTPRLLPRSSCHSSTTTARSARKRDEASAYDKSSASDSGVITSTSALPWRASRLSRALASPVRKATVQPRPSSLAVWAKARAVSVARARSGVTQSTRGPAPVVGLATSGLDKASNNGPPKAAKVLPLPVGVCSKPDSPARYRCQVSR